MELRNIPIANLIFAEYNPRAIEEKNFEKLKESIRQFGIADPVIVNMHTGRENIIIGGHMRTLAAKQLGITEVPCFILNLNEKKEKALNVALNNKEMQGAFDKGRLSELIVSLQADEEVKLLGFDEEQISTIVGESGENPSVNTESEPKKKVEIQLGDFKIVCPEHYDPQELDVIVASWQSHTGKVAQRLT